MRNKLTDIIGDIFALLTIILIGIGLPTALTWALSNILSSWTPLSVLVLIGLIVLWSIGFLFTGFGFLAWLGMLADK